MNKSKNQDEELSEERKTSRIRINAETDVP